MAHSAATALHLLTAGANMLLMHTVSPTPKAPPIEKAARPRPRTVGSAQTHAAAPPHPVASIDLQTPAAPLRRSPGARESVRTGRSARPPSSSQDVLPAPEKVNLPIRTVTLADRTRKAVTIGGAAALPSVTSRAIPGIPGRRDGSLRPRPENYPSSLREAYGSRLTDPAAMARYCVERLGAEVISVRLLGTHPDNGNRSPEQARR